MWPLRRSSAKSQPGAISKAELVQLYRKALKTGVPLDAVEEKVQHLWTRTHFTEGIESLDDNVRQEKLKKSVPAVVRYGSLILPTALVVAGLALIGSATFPIITYFVSTLPNLQANAVLSPVPQEQVLDVNPIVIAQAQAEEPAKDTTSQPIILDEELDFTNLSNWFSESSVTGALSGTTPSEQVYTIDIPKLNIANAKVIVGGTDLAASLIHYPGTAEPGEFGSPVIFGHSVLRQFYNPSEKNPRRYTSIFSTIMTMKKGDEIFVTYDGVKYKYIVQEKTEVKPEDTFILTQKFDAKTLKLVTCTPEGTYLRRGIVVAQLVSEE